MNHKIKDLKKVVCNKTNIKSEDIRIIFAVKELHPGLDEKTLGEVGISEGSNLTIVLRLRGGANIEIWVKLACGGNEEIKLDVNSNITVKILKHKIYESRPILPESKMSLEHASVMLKDEKPLSFYKIKSGDTIMQSKVHLEYVSGLILSFEPDMLSLDESIEARAKMSCGHVISTESMTQFMRSIISERKYKIICPAYKGNGKPCEKEWDYAICKEIAVLTAEE